MNPSSKTVSAYVNGPSSVFGSDVYRHDRCPGWDAPDEMASYFKQIGKKHNLPKVVGSVWVMAGLPANSRWRKLSLISKIAAVTGNESWVPKLVEHYVETPEHFTCIDFSEMLVYFGKKEFLHFFDEMIEATFATEMPETYRKHLLSVLGDGRKRLEQK